MKLFGFCRAPVLVAALLCALSLSTGLLAVFSHAGRAAAQASPVNCDVDPSQLTMDAEELQALNETNAYRIANGLLPLRPDAILTRIAEWKANEMMETVASGGSPTHDDDGYRTWQQRFADCGYTMTFPDALYGENLDGGHERGPTTILDFKNSPEHNENLLRPTYTAVGIKRVRARDPNDKYQWYWSMELGSEVDEEVLRALNAWLTGAGNDQ